jgi:aminopeptidase N
VVSLAPRGSEPGAELAAEAAAAALRACQRRFGDYPYSRFTLVAAPFSSYGLEFSGIVLLASRLFNLAGSEGGLPNRVLLESTAVHETAHQWFYGLVGNDPLEEPWLDEALAQYATWLCYRDRYGEGPAAGLLSSFEQRWERVHKEPIPIGLPVREYSALQYGAIVYGRAPLFLRALSQRMGEAGFDRLLSGYVRRWRWRLASGGDFLAQAGETCGCQLEDLIERWGALPARK